MAGLGALAQLHLDHPDLRVAGGRGELFRVEGAIGGAAAEIARSDFPDQVAARLAVIGAHPAFARVMGKAAEAGAAVQRPDGVGRQRAEAHRRDVEHRGIIGLAAGRAADPQAEAFAGRGFGRDRMVQPFEMAVIDIVVGAEGPLVELVLGPLVDDGALVARKRHAALVVLEEILPDLGPDILQQEAQVPDDGIVAQDRVPGLEQVPDTDQRQGQGDGQPGQRQAAPCRQP